MSERRRLAIQHAIARRSRPVRPTASCPRVRDNGNSSDKHKTLRLSARYRHFKQPQLGGDAMFMFSSSPSTTLIRRGFPATAEVGVLDPVRRVAFCPLASKGRFAALICAISSRNFAIRSLIGRGMGNSLAEQVAVVLAPRCS
jgi:hypothetical protein